MEQRISSRNWGATMLLCLFFGGFGAHRFYAGRIGSGFLWLFTLGLLGFGSLVDFIMICTGDFTDDTGALILSESKKETFYAEHPEARKYPNRPYYAPAPEAAKKTPSGVIHLNHIPADNAEQVGSVSRYVAMGIAVNGDKIVEVAALKINGGHIEGSYSASAFDITPEALVRLLGAHTTLIAYDIRAAFPAFAALLRDIDHSAEWDYIDLKELCAARSDVYAPKANAYDEATAASAYFEQARGGTHTKSAVSILDTLEPSAIAKFEVVGESYYKDTIARLCDENDDYFLSNARLLDQYDDGDRIYQYSKTTEYAYLIDEPANPYDPNAIAVYIDDDKVGYIARTDQKAIAPYFAREDLSWKAEISCRPFKEIAENADGDLCVKKRNYDFSILLLAYKNMRIGLTQHNTRCSDSS